MKEKIREIFSFWRRAVVLVLAIWLLVMGTLTYAVAEDFYHQLESWTGIIANQWSHRPAGEYSADFPGIMERETIANLGVPYYISLEKTVPFQLQHTLKNEISSRDWLWGKWNLLFGFEAAVAYFTDAGEPLLATGNYLSFLYTHADHWEKGETNPEGYGYLALDQIPQPNAFLQLFHGYPTGDYAVSLLVPVMKMTGYFAGNAFCPVSAVRGYADLSAESIDNWCEADRMGKIQWESYWEQLPPENQRLTTIYCWDFAGIQGEKNAVKLEDGFCESLGACLQQGEYPPSAREKNLKDTIIIRSARGADDFGPYEIRIGLRCYPLQYAAVRLIPAYAVSLLLVWLLLRQIRRNLVNPMEAVACAAAEGRALEPSAAWQEVYELEEAFAKLHQQQAETSAKLQQTNTALAYAKDAEKNRRQLVSNLTHQLKNPLAVIHSYGEALLANIQEDKREQYLSVIMEETEKMDAMVMHMLDLSRLEAGRVRLSLSSCTLLEITQSVVQQFEPLLKEKELRLHYAQTEKFLITADEARLREAISNLLSNAVKYTPKGGNIVIRIWEKDHAAQLAIANTCDCLPDVVIQKAWDTFYRAPSAEAEPGTGLGLAIVKGIITLHQGQCWCKNIWNGKESQAEFGFCLPLK